jgi:hypothetical protein
MLGLAAGAAVMGAGSAALAQCSSGCTPDPCTSCQPPEPPTPPSCGDGGSCGGGGGGGGHGGWNSNTNVNVNVNLNAGATATASSGARAYINARAGGFAGGYGYGGGGGAAYVTVDQPYPTTIQGLAVEGLAQTVRTPFTAYRRMMKRVVIQAVCIDDRQVPHPASQVKPDREIADGYEGEIYRCLAGTWLQATIADYEGEIKFDHGTTLTCNKHEALWFGGEGRLECRPEKPERDCNERSLLRRYGAGVKILTMYREEEYTEYREEVQSATVVTGAITLDGGVGGRVF